MNKAMELLRCVFGEQQAQQELTDSCIEIIIDPVVDVPVRPRLEATLSCPKLNKELSDGMTIANNVPVATVLESFSGAIDQEGFGKVWIYNVSELTHVLGNSSIKRLEVPACEEGQEYAVATSIPEIFKTPKHYVDSNTVECFIEDGKRIAQDLINPQNFGLDQDDDTAGIADGCNYNLRGVFWSTHNPPLKKELKAAHKRLKRYYEQVLDIANLERITAAAKRLNIPASVVNAADKYVA